MESAILLKARRQLAFRLVIFLAGLLCIFDLETSHQLRQGHRLQQQKTLQLLGTLAAEKLRDGEQRQGLPHGMAHNTSPESQELAMASEAMVRILWIGPSMTILDEFGSFVPGGRLVPVQSSRLQTQWMSLSNGLALWLPIRAEKRERNQGKLLGFIVVAVSHAASQREVLISIMAATASSILLALLCIPWILERSLQPLREQITRLNQFAADVAHELRNPLMALKTSLANAHRNAAGQKPSAIAIAPISADPLPPAEANIAAESSQPAEPITAAEPLLPVELNLPVEPNLPAEPSVLYESTIQAEPSVQAELQKLDRISSRMAAMLDDILLLTSIENGWGDAGETSIRVSLAELFDELSILHDAEARTRQVDLNFRLETPIVLTIVPARLQRILSNLISNAIRFSASGSSVQITASRSGKAAQITVDDHGPGIPSHLQDRVFERFVRLQATQADSNHAGLGLALSRSLAQLHGGSLQAGQAPSGGCRMLLQLPLERPSRNLGALLLRFWR